MSNYWQCPACSAHNESNSSACWKCKKISATKLAEEQERNRRENAELGELEDFRHAARIQAEELEATNAATLPSILMRATGGDIRINLSEPTNLVSVKLLSVQGDHFVVGDSETRHCIPYGQITRIHERRRGFGEDELFPALTVEIMHLVVYKGAVGVGVSIPMK